jgi:predicted permease
VLQAALSVILLVGAGLFVRSLQKVQSLHLGYDADRLVWIEPHLRGQRLDSAQSAALRFALLDRALHNPEVENASLVVTVPFSSTYSDEVYVPGADSTRQLKDVIMQIASPSYFATTGTRILRGRGVSAEDRAGTPRVAVVSAEMARTAWPKQDPIGKCLKASADTMPCRTVVGIAEDIRLSHFSGPTSPMVYFPVAQEGENQGTVYVRMRGDAVLRAEALRRDLQHVMPGAGYLTATPVGGVIAPATRSWRLGATMFAVFGGLALALAAIGLYSVIAYSVTQRTHEMGVRLALGARVADVVSMIVRDGLRVVIVGVAIGLVVAFSAGRWLAPLLFEVSPKDPLIYGSVAALLLGVAVAASWLPALRASRVDPSTALRAD